jgi:MFS family permease
VFGQVRAAVRCQRSGGETTSVDATGRGAGVGVAAVRLAGRREWVGLAVLALAVLAGGTAFGVVSLLAAWSTSPELLIAARALLGLPRRPWPPRRRPH